MTQDWFFVIGIAVEISGALLVGGQFIFSSRIDHAARGMTFPTSGPTIAAQRERAFAYVGACLLVVGFVLQLIGYVIASGDYWFLLVAATVIAAL